MAAELIIPTAPGDQLPAHNPARHFAPQRPAHTRSLSYQVPRHPASANVSPLSTSGDKQQQHQQQTAASTPGSPKDGAPHGRLMYMPAVLRPNSEFTANKLTRASTAGQDNESTSTSGRRLSASGFIPGLVTIGQRLTRRTTSDSGKCPDAGWNLQLFPQVTDLPTRKHWKVSLTLISVVHHCHAHGLYNACPYVSVTNTKHQPDPESTVCDEPICKRNFNYFNRRHHCRRCGNIFCDAHSSFEVPLDQDANFNPRAAPSRTCNHCFEQYKSWHTRNNSQTSSSASSDIQNAMPPTPVAAIPGSHAIPGAVALGLSKSPDVAASVPRDWNWSTF